MSKKINVSWSRLREWMTCHWRYRLTYEDYMTPKRVAEPLYLGSAFHKLMEYLYSETGGNPIFKRRNRKAMRTKLKRMGFEEDKLDTMLGYVMRYLDHIKKHKSQEPSQVLATEFGFSVPMDVGHINQNILPIGAHLPYLLVNFIGVMDIIVIRRGRVEIWDHKLQSNHPRTGDLDHPSISYPQMGLYAYASTWLGYFIKRSTLNIYGKRRAKNNVQRYPLLVTIQEAKNWGEWLHRKVAEMLTSRDRSKSLGSMYCSFCDFRFACVKHLTQGNKGLEMALDQGFEKKSFDYRSRMKWNTRFPPDLLKKMRKVKK